MKCSTLNNSDIMKKIALLLNVLLVATICVAQKQTYKFDFSSDKKVKEGYLKVTPQTLFNNEQGYGYDLQPAWDGKSNKPFFFSVNVPDGNYKKFLENNSDLKPKKGNIVNSKGEILGKHTGLYNYTIGQRKGLGISYRVPLFVIGFNPLKNEVIVGEESELYQKQINVTDVNLLLIDEIKEPIEVEVKTRYSSKVAKATIEQNGENQVKVIFDEPQRAITPGQSAVFYVGDLVLGGGKIC